MSWYGDQACSIRHPHKRPQSIQKLTQWQIVVGMTIYWGLLCPTSITPWSWSEHVYTFNSYELLLIHHEMSLLSSVVIQKIDVYSKHVCILWHITTLHMLTLKIMAWQMFNSQACQLPNNSYQDALRLIYWIFLSLT